MKVAALDLGSNSFLCLIAELDSSNQVNAISDEVEIVRLGEGVSKTKSFAPAALERADSCLQKFAQRIKQHKPDKVLAVATAAARDVENASEIEKICTSHGIPLSIISGNQEALLTYTGAISSLKKKDNAYRAVIDIGGGSTEIIIGNESGTVWSHSFPLGGVKLTEKFITQHPVSLTETRALHSHILQCLENHEADIKKFKIAELIAVAGTPTELAKMEIGHFDVQKIDGYNFPLTRLKDMYKQLGDMSVQERIYKMGVSSGRADIIYSGLMILLEFIELFQLNELKVSTRGLRYGLAEQMLQNKI